jgi:hypothetical protein
MEISRGYRDGTLRLTVPEGYAVRLDAERPQRPVVAVLTEWEGPESQRPEIAVAVDEPTPALATIAQLSAATVAAQIARGRHVVAVDVWPPSGAGGAAPGRRVESVSADPAGHGATVVQLHYLTIRAGRCVTVSLRHVAAGHAALAAAFDLVGETLALELPAVRIAPDPAAMPALDSRVTGASGDAAREDLGEIRDRQPFISTAHRLNPRDVDTLRGKRVLINRREHTAALVAAGFLSERGRRLTPAGRLARELLTRPAAEFHAEVTEPGQIRPHRLRVWGRGWDALVQAETWPWAAPEDDQPGRTLDLVPSNTVAVLVARWLGVAPAWPVELAPADAPDRQVSVPREVWQACQINPAVPAPPDMTEAFERMWSESWRVAVLRSSAIKRGPARIRLLFTGEMGIFVVRDVPEATEVTLEPYSSAELMRLLLIFTGALELPLAAPR